MITMLRVTRVAIAFFLVAAGCFLSTQPVLALSRVSSQANLVLPPSSGLCVNANGDILMAHAGQVGRGGDGVIRSIRGGQAQDFVSGMDDPGSIVSFNDSWFVVDNNRIFRVTAQGKVEPFLTAEDFPAPLGRLGDITALSSLGLLLVSDLGNGEAGSGGVFLIRVRNKNIKRVAGIDNIPAIGQPLGVVFDGESFFMFADQKNGELYRVSLIDGRAERISANLTGASDLIWDNFGQLFVTSNESGNVWAIPRPGEEAIVLNSSAQGSGSGALSADGQQLLIPQTESGKWLALSANVPGWEVDQTPIAVTAKVAFPEMKWNGWDDGSETGIVNPLRPLVLTHANDGSNRVYVATQHGVIHVLDNSDRATQSQVFLDLNEKVRYRERENEEGFLGLAFHPRFAETGEFFVFYTDIKAKMANVVSRFRVRADNPQVADLESEEELIRFEKPYWNHDGGCLVFGPDGYLYISHGDGGAGGDPHGNGQNLKTLLGKVLRIDVDRKSEGKNYAIPADNPFVSNPEARPEIYAYGLRNIWRMAFDRETDLLWGGEVGQNLFEEIVLIRSGGNYGWNPREGFHPFGAGGLDVNPAMIEPIWEYHHDLGKSITGGAVYRGQAIPALRGAYVYADYVSGRVWALRYDAAANRVTANQPIAFPANLQILSFGEDQNGELYALVASPSGRGIFRFVADEPK